MRGTNETRLPYLGWDFARWPVAVCMVSGQTDRLGKTDPRYLASVIRTCCVHFRVTVCPAACFH